MPLIENVNKELENYKNESELPKEVKTLEEVIKETGSTAAECNYVLNKLQKEGKVDSTLIFDEKEPGIKRRVFFDKVI